MTEQGVDQASVDRKVDRRGFLRKFAGRSAAAAAVAGAAGGAGALLAGPAGAAENDTILIGSANDAHNTGTGTTTKLTNSPLRVNNTTGQLGFSSFHNQAGAVAVQTEAASGVGVFIQPDGGTTPMPPSVNTVQWAGGSLRTDGNNTESNLWVLLCRWRRFGQRLVPPVAHPRVRPRFPAAARLRLASGLRAECPAAEQDERR